MFTPSKPCLKAFSCPPFLTDPNHAITHSCPRMSPHIHELHLPITVRGYCSLFHGAFVLISTTGGGGWRLYFLSLASSIGWLPNIGIFTRNLWGSWLMIDYWRYNYPGHEESTKTLLSPIVLIFFPACTWPSPQLLIKGVNKDNNTLIGVSFPGYSLVMNKGTGQVEEKKKPGPWTKDMNFRMMT